MDFQLFHPFVKKIFHSKAGCIASKCGIIQKCDISLPKTLMTITKSRKKSRPIGIHLDSKLLTQLLFDNASQTGILPFLFSLTYWHDYPNYVRSPPKIKLYLLVVARMAAYHILLEEIMSLLFNNLP